MAARVMTVVKVVLIRLTVTLMMVIIVIFKIIMKIYAIISMTGISKIMKIMIMIPSFANLMSRFILEIESKSFLSIFDCIIFGQQGRRIFITYRKPTHVLLLRPLLLREAIIAFLVPPRP